MMSDEVELIATGVKQQGNPRKIHATMPEYVGKHLWIFVAVFAVQEPARSNQDFDSENLLTIEGPGCYWCEQVWKSTIGSKCPGVPDEQ